jgi:hypothetical protein
LFSGLFPPLSWDTGYSLLLWFSVSITLSYSSVFLTFLICLYFRNFSFVLRCFISFMIKGWNFCLFFLPNISVQLNLSSNENAVFLKKSILYQILFIIALYFSESFIELCL